MLRWFVLAAALLMSGCSQQTPQAPESVAEKTPPAAATQIPDPAGLIRPLYDRYLTPPNPDEEPPPFSRQAPWSAAMSTAIQALEARANTDPYAPALDFDPFTHGQGGAITNVQVTTDAVAENSHAVVRAMFTRAGAPDEVVYDLIWEDGGWRIDNMRGSDWDLRAFLAQSVR